MISPRHPARRVASLPILTANKKTGQRRHSAVPPVLFPLFSGHANHGFLAEYSPDIFAMTGQMRGHPTLS